MFEKKTQPLASKSEYYKRITKGFFYMLFFLIIFLGIGVLGYHYTADIPWLDAMHNASMILSGMGPVVEIKTDAGKWFSSFYALFSGVAFITNISLLLAPMVHRFFHKLHIDEN